RADRGGSVPSYLGRGQCAVHIHCKGTSECRGAPPCTRNGLSGRSPSLPPLDHPDPAYPRVQVHSRRDPTRPPLLLARQEKSTWWPGGSWVALRRRSHHTFRRPPAAMVKAVPSIPTSSPSRSTRSLPGPRQTTTSQDRRLSTEVDIGRCPVLRGL